MGGKTTEEVMHLYADCLHRLYLDAGLPIPDKFDPDVETGRLIHAFQSIDRSIKNADATRDAIVVEVIKSLKLSDKLHRSISTLLLLQFGATPINTNMGDE